MPPAELATQSEIQSLYRDHHGWLRSWLWRRMGNSADASDLAQDTFLRLLSSSKPLLGLGEPRSYLRVIAERLCVDLWRRRSVEQAWLDMLAQRPEATMISPEAQAILVETLMEVDRMLQRLPEKVAIAFMLAQFDGLTYKEIAERLGVTDRSVKKYMAQAMFECMLLEATLNEALEAA